MTTNVVLPGRIHTERVDQLDDVAAARGGSTRDAVKASIATILTGRYRRTREFTDVVTFLVSERTSCVTGAKSASIAACCAESGTLARAAGPFAVPAPSTARDSVLG